MIRAEHLRDDLDGGEATWSEVDQAVERVVAAQLRFADVLAKPAPGREVLADDAHRSLAREAAAKSVVLLRNEPVDGAPLLPIGLPPGGSIALFGTLADTVNLGDGGSSDVWAPQVVTVAEGLASALPACPQRRRHRPRHGRHIGRLLRHRSGGRGLHPARRG